MVYPPERNYGCRLVTDVVLKGMRTVILENQLLRITVLVDKGTDIWELLYKPLDIDFMWRSPMGLRNPNTFIPSSGTGKGFWFDYWEGAWQEVLPNGGVASSYKEADYGLHGESSLIPWDFRVVEDSPERVSVTFWARMYRSPFYIEKTLTLEEHSGALTIEETLVNEGREEMAFMWGHHPAVGESFLDEHCTIDTGARRVHVMPGEPFFETQRFKPGDDFRWPMGESRDGESIDVSLVPPAANNTADMLYLSDCEEGWFAITNQRLELGLGLVWPKEVFRYIWLWQVCKGWYEYPLYGRSHVMALEPFTSKPNAGISGAIEDGTAMYLGAGESISLEMKAIVYTGKGRVQHLAEDGSIEWK
jgi:hypothetical protein